MKAHLRGIRISPRKMNIVAGVVRGMALVDALDALRFIPKKGARYLYKVLHSAMANATHNEQKSAENLKVGEIIVNKGPVQKRFLPSTRGRALPLRKPTTHITVSLTDK